MQINSEQVKKLLIEIGDIPNDKTNIMETVKLIWNFAKPIIIIVIALLGMTFTKEFIPRNFFISIAILELVLRGKPVVDGFVALYNYFFAKA